MPPAMKARHNVAVDATLTSKIRTALRITGTDTGITNEINDSIEACRKELAEVGVVNVDDTDALIIRAYILHARADFDFGGKGEQFRAAFVSLKGALSMAEDYNTAATPDEITVTPASDESEGGT